MRELKEAGWADLKGYVVGQLAKQGRSEDFLEDVKAFLGLYGIQASFALTSTHYM